MRRVIEGMETSVPRRGQDRGGNQGEGPTGRRRGEEATWGREMGNEGTETGGWGVEGWEKTERKSEAGKDRGL